MSLCDEYPVTVICDVLDCSRSSVYYQSQSQNEADLRAAIEHLAGQWVTYGYRLITKMLQREGWVVNHKRVHRLMREMGLLQKRKPCQPRTTRVSIRLDGIPTVSNP